jgi:hypothetical protein
VPGRHRGRLRARPDPLSAYLHVDARRRAARRDQAAERYLAEAASEPTVPLQATITRPARRELDPPR